MDLSPDEEHFQGRLLHQAALWDNVELLEELLSNGAEVDARDSSSRSALHAAALAERSRCLAALCSAGADLDARCGTAAGGKTALHIAAERGHVENVRVLVAAGASLHLLDAAGSSALALAERNNHRHAAQVLRDARDAQERERLSHHAQLRELVTRGDVQQLKSKLTSLGSDAELIVNLTPGGANTLLYAAAEAGLTAGVSLLLEAGADGRAHPVTKYSPLYIACYLGRTDIVKLLLANFPHAVQQETVEKWLPLHAACLGGHAGVVSLLLEYPYPASVLNTYLDASGKCRYLFAFDVNARDARGHTALYAASALGDARVLAALLDHTVPCLPDDKEEQPLPGAAGAGAGEARVSPQRGALAHGIHAIVSRLTGAAQQQHESGPERSVRVRPARTDLPCAGDTCVAVAARCSHTAALRRLLAAGADPDALSLPPPDLGSSAEGVRETRRSRSACPLPARSKPSLSPSPTRTYNTNRGSGERGGSGVGEGGGGGWTALGVAARACNVPVVEALVGHGATDPGGRALRECARHGLTHLLEMLLATRAYPDPDNKLNKSAICERVLSGGGEGRERELTYSAVCPTTPVIINWRELRAHVDHLRMSWVRAAALRVNSQLGSGRAALHGVTRLDISNNELRLLPPELFSLLSLRYLNAAQNKLERLPTSEDPFEEEPENKGRRFKRKNKPRGDIYTAPVLQELFLQDNRLEEVPAEVFLLPALAALDLANNKLRALPPALWAAPALRDLSAALNHLRDLPAPAQVEGQGAEQTTSPSEPCAQAHSSPSTPQLGFASWSSRGSPAERPGGKGDEEQEELESGVPVLGDRSGNAVWSEAKRAHTWRSWWECPPAAPPPPPPAGACGGGGGASPLASLNLSHNQFACVPAVLACRATSLTRLNMSYNLLRSMSYVTSYPSSLRQLDLSHNEISCWPSLPQIEQFGSAEEDPLACYCPGVSGASAGGVRVRVRSQSQSHAHAHAHAGGSVRAQLLGAACAARRHLRLEGLRTLILANNMLTRIQLTTDDDGESPATYPDPATDDDDEWGSGSQVRGRLLFPLLSMLDVSCNLLRSIPPAIHELTNLSVLNISGNKEVTELPATMGLLSRLWNLNVSGCEVSEPLRSMVRSGRYKTMDIVGYLKSVLQEARPYTTMKLMLVGVQGIGKTSLLECLRQESALHHRRKPTEHWAKRMGNKSSGRGNLSTVGVDIGLWVYEKHRSSRGPVTFRTWDFGGQHEYYATHQYFLSRRSLYLVLWKVTEGRRGLAGALHWLRSIQARAPGSPVIMVATHYDQVNNSNLPESESPEALQRLIRSSIMGAPDADKMGLPRVLDSLEVSCSSRHNIRLLADIIYSVAFSVKPSGCKEPLLEQKVPATYLALEECVTALAAELKEPVLGHAEYKRLVTQYMQQKNHRMFRDAAELHQATMFLHENGVLLHYDDATLKQLYFLRPQWLCDVLAHVLTVREINPFANNGIMKAEDVSHVFKASPALGHGAEARALALSLLNKFELALSWDARVLLVPPLLPAAEPARPQLPVRPRRAWPADPPAPAQEEGSEEGGSVRVSARCAGAALRRLVLLSYVPQGFWPRLLTRVVADPALAHAPSALYKLAPEMEAEARVSRALQLPWGWKLWRSGLAVCAGPLTLASLRDVPPAADALLPTTAHEHDTDHPYANIKLRVRQEGAWCDLDVQSSACVEILLPAHQCVLRRDDGMPLAGYQSISLEPNPEILAKVLALLSDHVDLLLEDWYPSLGTRFVHTSEGRCLITRVVPCPSCLRDAHQQPHQPLHDDQFAQAFRGMEIGSRQASREENGEVRRPRLSEDSRTSDGDSGVGADSNPPSRLGSAEGAAGAAGAAGRRVAYGWTVEECILAACTGQRLHCALHDQLQLSRLAPDTLLLDVEEERRARWEQISRGAVAGRGAFGTVVRARWRRGGECVEVAVKALQPVAGVATGAEAARWERDAAGAACRAYCGLRQELCILSQLRHAHVVPLVGVCAAPLALLLALAPRGALDAALRDYRCEARAVGVRCARALLLQVARALEYLHARRILYRDLKSENVLVWRLPRPQEAAAAELSAAPIDVHVKLGDYGISRLAPPSGTKGFGGTEGFMAPEIMRYNGEEEYTEKVDCFSYGMLIYEIVTCRQPFEGHEAVKEAILEGARPALTVRESRYACCVLETMRRCWSGAAESRPSAAALVSLASAPECAALADAAQARCAVAAAVTPLRAAPEEGGAGWEVWYGGGEPERLHALFATHSTFTQHHSLRIPAERAEPVLVTAVCRVGTTMWVGDSAGRLTLYSTSSCEVRWSVRVSEVVGGAPSAVAALRPLPALRRLALALACGRLFLVTSSRPEAEGSFVLTELGAAQDLCCLTAISTPTGYEVWAGGDALYAYGVREGGVCGAERVCVTGRVTLVAAEPAAPYVFACSEPGVCVLQYSVLTKRPAARLDCSKLAPCSETLQSISIEEHQSHGRSRVTALCAAAGKLFAGTAWGCLVVADAASLRPLTVCRPYERDVQAIVSLPAGAGAGEEAAPLLATFGAHYRPLHNRYAPQQTQSSASNANNYSGYYCLLWRAHHWLPD